MLERIQSRVNVQLDSGNSNAKGAALQFKADLQTPASWKVAKPKIHYAWVCKPSLGTSIRCPFTGRALATNKEQAFLLSGTRGEVSLISSAELGKQYVTAEGEPLTGAFFKSKADKNGNVGWVKVRYRGEYADNANVGFKALHCPLVLTNISGFTLEPMNDTRVPQHGTGDFLVVPYAINNPQSFGTPFCVNGLVFGDLYDIRGWSDQLPTGFAPITEPRMPAEIESTAGEISQRNWIPSTLYNDRGLRTRFPKMQIELDKSATSSITIQLGSAHTSAIYRKLSFAVNPQGALGIKHEIYGVKDEPIMMASSGWVSLEKYTGLSMAQLSSLPAKDLYASLMRTDCLNVSELPTQTYLAITLQTHLSKSVYARLSQEAMPHDNPDGTTRYKINDKVIIKTGGVDADSGYTESIVFCEDILQPGEMAVRYSLVKHLPQGKKEKVARLNWMPLRAPSTGPLTSITGAELEQVFKELREMAQRQA